MSESTFRSKIRSQIKPFPKIATYPTGWGGAMTFDAIAERIGPLMAKKITRFGVFGQDIPDSVQTGLMKLWLKLTDEPELLACDALTRTVWRAIAVCSCMVIVDKQERYNFFADIQANTGMDVDEYGVHGDDSRLQLWDAKERWAGFATRIDVQFDIERAITTIAQHYADDITGLVALYILTTDAKPLQTINAHNLPQSSVYARLDQIQERLQTLLAEYKPEKRRTWRERFDNGEIAPYLEVVTHYEDRPLALAALYTLSTQAKVRHFVTCENERRTVTRYRRAALKRLETAYGRAVSF
ncbi:MAG: hypothetical protein CL607_04340 [Anaerolineaceae bacterium]|nr:hypothetical protein [Anaerolineaceae bacterium]